jgi:hypothetical protein
VIYSICFPPPRPDEQHDENSYRESHSHRPGPLTLLKRDGEDKIVVCYVGVHALRSLDQAIIVHVVQAPFLWMRLACEPIPALNQERRKEVNEDDRSSKQKEGNGQNGEEGPLPAIDRFGGQAKSPSYALASLIPGYTTVPKDSNSKTGCQHEPQRDKSATRNDENVGKGAHVRDLTMELTRAAPPRLAQ